MPFEKKNAAAPHRALRRSSEVASRRTSGVESDNPLWEEYEAFALRFNAPVDGKVIVSNNPPWGKDVDIALWLFKNFPQGFPQAKVLKDGTDLERRLYGAIHRRKMHSFIGRYKPYGDPREFYRKNYSSLSIGQVQKLNPEFVNYCRYNKMDYIFPRIDRTPWKGREAREFVKKHGTGVNLAELLQTSEGHRDYMRVYRAGKLSELYRRLGIRAPITRARKMPSEDV